MDLFPPSKPNHRNIASFLPMWCGQQELLQVDSSIPNRIPSQGQKDRKSRLTGETNEPVKCVYSLKNSFTTAEKTFLYQSKAVEY